ncbi:MAG: hypothetical protein UY28_C0011G0005 [Candidatus Amesbacteria bacterium GW2011_GWB1_48_13]|uniref:Uncharacterized protein n=1 Tax=Candidatus Amesbacteria bacterium GW2011_GWB1_48_13 TaxID=1618362 RepID=A0A0G1XUC5_9BACT|nr:MAG: hypothetical protein UY28_C0011G0005 [Candidatus Amesbacteria bacterium GW2011_GWB1_48_13]
MPSIAEIAGEIQTKVHWKVRLAEILPKYGISLTMNESWELNRLSACIIGGGEHIIVIQADQGLCQKCSLNKDCPASKIDSDNHLGK